MKHTHKSYMNSIYRSYPYGALLKSIEIAKSVHSEEKILNDLDDIRRSMKAVSSNAALCAAVAHGRGSEVEAKFYICKALTTIDKFHDFVVENYIRLGLLYARKASIEFCEKKREALG